MCSVGEPCRHGCPENSETGAGEGSTGISIAKLAGDVTVGVSSPADPVGDVTVGVSSPADLAGGVTFGVAPSAIAEVVSTADIAEVAPSADLVEVVSSADLAGYITIDVASSVFAEVASSADLAEAASSADLAEVASSADLAVRNARLSGRQILRLSPNPHEHVPYTGTPDRGLRDERTSGIGRGST